MPAATTTATLTTTEAAVLVLLEQSGEASGYDLLRQAQSGVGHVWAPARSRLYTLLPRLVERGLAERRRVAQPTRPDKQIYRATAAGREALGAWLARAEPGSEDAFYLRVFAGGLLPAGTLAAHVRQFRADAEERLAVLHAVEATNTGTGNDRYSLLLLRLGIERAEHAIDWADWALGELGA